MNLIKIEHTQFKHVSMYTLRQVGSRTQKNTLEVPKDFFDKWVQVQKDFWNMQEEFEQLLLRANEK